MELIKAKGLVMASYYAKKVSIDFVGCTFVTAFRNRQCVLLIIPIMFILLAMKFAIP